MTDTRAVRQSSRSTHRSTQRLSTGRLSTGQQADFKLYQDRDGKPYLTQQQEEHLEAVRSGRAAAVYADFLLAMHRGDGWFAATEDCTERLRDVREQLKSDD